MTAPVTTKQAAQILGCNASRVRQLILSGRLHAKKHGRDWLMSKNTILKFARLERKSGRPSSKLEETMFYFAYFDDTNQSCRIYHTGQILPKSKHWHLFDSEQDYKKLVSRVKEINPDAKIEVL